MASHEMIKANRETKISHIATKIIEAWIDEWMPKNQAKPIKKVRKKHKNDEKHPKNVIRNFVPPKFRKVRYCCRSEPLR